MHEDTQKFCQQTFCTQSFSSFADQNMITWIGKVWDPEAYGLSIQYKVTAFPYCALLVCQSQRSVQIVAKFEGDHVFFTYNYDYILYLINLGHIEENQLTEQIRNSVAANNSNLTRIMNENIRRYIEKDL
jgi:hypothetical protein